MANLTDEIVPFQVEGPGLRGRLVRLGPALEAMAAPHAYPETAAAMLGEATALSCVLASGLKYDGVFILQVQGDGPISVLVADITSEGAVRGTVRFDADRLAAAAAAEGAAVPRLLGAGHLAFTVDQGAYTDRYQGITALDGATLGECAHHYFRDSEQVETAIVLAADGAGPLRAAALMIQRMPDDKADEEAEEAWRRAVVLASSVTRDELLDPALAPADLLFRLFHEDGIRLFDSRPLHYACRCSRERVAETLRAMKPEDLVDLVQDGRITVTCEFCKTDYRFAPDEVAKA